jgi:hypothetical protein
LKFPAIGVLVCAPQVRDRFRSALRHLDGASGVDAVQGSLNQKAIVHIVINDQNCVALRFHPSFHIE